LRDKTEVKDQNASSFLAGKTEASKGMMQYIAAVTGSSRWSEKRDFRVESVVGIVRKCKDASQQQLEPIWEVH
jgi:hypothetical protein